MMQKKLQTAVILVGGSGLRMRPLTEDLPKCMVPLHGKPLIYWTLTWLRDSGFEHVVLGVSYQKEVVIKYVTETSLGIRVDFSAHTQEGETGEGFRLAIKRHVKDENFLAMNGDELTNLNLEKFVDFHLRNGGVATVAVSPMKSPFAVLEIEGNNVVGFEEKPIPQPTMRNLSSFSEFIETASCQSELTGCRSDIHEHPIDGCGAGFLVRFLDRRSFH